MSALRDAVEDSWQTLDTGSPSTATSIITDTTTVDTPNGPVLLGVGADRTRHLLVPLASRQTVEADVRGRAVHLRMRPLEDATVYRVYADLMLLDPSLGDVFTTLCENVLDAIKRRPDRAVRAVRTVLSRWRELLSGAHGPLGPEQLAGLFGELSVLAELLEIDSGAAGTWHGPSGTAQDFHLAGNAIEVKATTSPEGRTVRIHGIHQLEVPAGGELCLVWFRLARSPEGTTVPELVDRVVELADDASQIRRALTEAGYLERDAHFYETIKYTVLERQCYLVGPGFPRVIPSSLTGDSLLSGISELGYTVDLGAEPARACEVSDFRRFMTGAS